LDLIITKIPFFHVKDIAIYEDHCTVSVLNHIYGATKIPLSHDFDMSTWNLMRAYLIINIGNEMNAGQMIVSDGRDITVFTKEQNKNIAYYIDIELKDDNIIACVFSFYVNIRVYILKYLSAVIDRNNRDFRHLLSHNIHDSPYNYFDTSIDIDTYTNNNICDFVNDESMSTDRFELNKSSCVTISLCVQEYVCEYCKCNQYYSKEEINQSEEYVLPSSCYYIHNTLQTESSHTN
jgi:hypothetical protein